MDLEVKASAEEVGRAVAGTIAGQLRRKPDSVLGLPAGEAQLSAYAELVRLHRAEGLSFERATVFGLGEYVGLPAGHPASVRNLLGEALCRGVELPPERAHAPDGTASDLDEVCSRYEREIADAGGFDLVLLDLGTNGQVAFNEPGSSPDAPTRAVALSAETRAANQVFFGRQPVPQMAITVGLGTILSAARFCLLTAHGRARAQAVASTIEGHKTTAVPASILWRHPHAVACIDEDAAGRLSSAWRRDR